MELHIGDKVKFKNPFFSGAPIVICTIKDIYLTNLRGPFEETLWVEYLREGFEERFSENIAFKNFLMLFYGKLEPEEFTYRGELLDKKVKLIEEELNEK